MKINETQLMMLACHPDNAEMSRNKRKINFHLIKSVPTVRFVLKFEL